MTDIQQNISDSSSYSYKSLKYWCSSCNRQFSQLSVENAPAPSARCPRCNLFAELVSQPSSSGPSQPNHTTSSQAQARNDQQDGNQYVYYTQPVMDLFGRVYLQTVRVPANSQQTNTANNYHSHSHSNGRQHRQENNNANTSTGNLFSQLFGDFFGTAPSASPMFGFFGAGGDESVIEEFLRDDPNQYGPPPASKEDMNKLQEIKFDSAHSHKEGAENMCCPVCQEDYKEGESLVRLPCKHDYHRECVNTWLSKHNSCPMCRKAI